METESLADCGLILKALHFAADKHRMQRRKDPEASPYINHPIALTHILWHEGRVRQTLVIAAALLHDTVEDTDATLDEIEREFGPAVRNIVAEVTDDKSLPKLERKQLQIAHSPHLSQEAKLVKLADKISNLRDLIASPPADWSEERRQAYFQWARQVVAGLKGTNPVLEGIFEALFQQGTSTTS